MLVGIVSDTHDNVDAVERIVALFQERNVDTVIHCGDFIAPLVVPSFDDFELHGVLGNNDGEVKGLYDAFDALGNGSELHGRFADLEIDGVSIAVLHGESIPEVEAVAASGHYEAVCCGHYHRRDHRTVGDAMVVNPGAHFETVPDDHRTVALLETDTGDVSFEQIN